MTRSASYAELRYISLKLLCIKIIVGLCFDVVTEHAVRIPRRSQTEVIFSIGVKERAIEVHPSAIDQIICDGEARVLPVLFDYVLFDSTRADRPSDRTGFDAAIRIGEGYLKRTLATLHPRFNSLILEDLVVEITLDGFRFCVLGHTAVIGT